MKDDTALAVAPPILQTILSEARRPRSPAETEAVRLLVLGRIAFGEYIAALHDPLSRH